MAVEIAKGTKPAVDFVVQVLVGTTLFALVIVAAFLLSRLVAWMEHAGAPAWMARTADWAEWVLFWTDLFCGGLFLLSEVLKFIRGLIRNWKAE